MDDDTNVQVTRRSSWRSTGTARSAWTVVALCDAAMVGLKDRYDIAAALLSAETTAMSGRDPTEQYRALTRDRGDPAADRIRSEFSSSR